ncbi:unnamed protein product [Cyclocybe aegerita]|uniref:Cytochrome P450 n=1 Tax=Cyclocybe aegerita TaxID=1973307 RepID=A0A8S0VRD6_CYCAE|nr:unnamed protein product [Cyclocybe aegerita]
MDLQTLTTLASRSLGAILLASLAKALYSFLKTKERGPYPPGPKAKPLIGNAFDFPAKDGGQHFVKVGREINSDLIYLSALGTDILVLNKREDAEELLERRARAYSGRVQIPAMQAMGWDAINIVFMDYGDEWRAHRKACQQLLNQDKTRSYETVYLRHVYKLLGRLLDAPEGFLHHNELFPISITLDTLYGYQVNSLDDPVVIAAQKSAEGTSLLTPSAAYMNIFPILGHIPPWIPGSIARRKAEEYAHWTREMQRIPVEDVKHRMRDKTVVASTISDMLERKSAGEVSPKEENILYNVAYTLYGAAGETTVSSTGTFFHMIATHPDVQKKAQEEIERIIGTKHLPTFEDRTSLPYVEAIYREVMRYNPPGHLGVPHKTMEDDVHKGYFIPKGTAVFANIWSMTHDAERYTDPYEFKPERFLDENGLLNDDARVLAYGLGRRACVGKYVASATVWIMIASVLACFTIGKAKDEHANEIEINDEYEDNGGGVHKKPFKCSIVPRSELARKLIEEAAKI